MGRLETEAVTTKNGKFLEMRDRITNMNEWKKFLMAGAQKTMKGKANRYKEGKKAGTSLWIAS